MLQPVLPWNRWTPWARFEMFGCLKIPGIHVVQTRVKTVLVIDRTWGDSLLRLPNRQGAWAAELTLNTGGGEPFTQRALDVKTNTFCSTGQFLPNGTFLSIGGTRTGDTNPGATSIRAFTPCTDAECDFVLVANLTRRRWYATAQIMPDGRVLVVGGSDTMGTLSINSADVNNPTIEYFPRRAGEGNYLLPLLERTLPFNLYPFVHLLPSGLVFIFAQSSWTLLNPSTNQEVPGVYPDLSDVDEITGFPWFRTYPVTGTSAMFPLSSRDGYRAEVMICGGSVSLAFSKPQTTLADYRCWRIYPEDPSPSWTKEVMCDWPACTTVYRRVMGEMVLLVDGSLLLLGGAQLGIQSQLQPRGVTGSPQYHALIYLPHNHSWYPTLQLPASAVPRLYHSSAVLLHDATVLITGSNPNVVLNKTSPFPTEFRVEKFIPPYVLTGQPRPVIVQSPSFAIVNTTFQVGFMAYPRGGNFASLARYSVALVNPGFSTHNARHGMRNIVLDILSIEVFSNATSNRVIANVMAPPTLNIAPPGFYWLHVLDNGVPNVEGTSIQIKRLNS